jgi:hypothetical protein
LRQLNVELQTIVDIAGNELAQQRANEANPHFAPHRQQEAVLLDALANQVNATLRNLSALWPH